MTSAASADQEKRRKFRLNLYPSGKAKCKMATCAIDSELNNYLRTGTRCYWIPITLQSRYCTWSIWWREKSRKSVASETDVSGWGSRCGETGAAGWMAASRLCCSRWHSSCAWEPGTNSWLPAPRRHSCPLSHSLFARRGRSYKWDQSAEPRGACLHSNKHVPTFRSLINHWPRRDMRVLCLEHRIDSRKWNSCLRSKATLNPSL